MINVKQYKPSFWDAPPASPMSSAAHYRFDYKRIWKLSIVIMSLVALGPLTFITLVNYTFTQKAIELEWKLKTARTVSNTQRAVSFFLLERKAALDFIIAHSTHNQELRDFDQFRGIFEALQQSFEGGFVDLGLIVANGKQTMYVGPYNLEGKDYSQQPWFQHVKQEYVYISDVFLGYRHIPHLVIAVRKDLGDGSFYVVRSSLSIEPFEHLLTNLELGGKGDAFIINHEGRLQTPSKYHGKILETINLPLPQYSERTQVTEIQNGVDEPLVFGYRFIDETPFILMIVKKKNELLSEWYKARWKLIIFLLFSASFILSAIAGMVTYMVNRIYIADEKRLDTLHKIEYTNKLASIGRMAASVAHEINNPLAIINEKAGLIKDTFVIKKKYSEDEKLIGMIDSVLRSVKRAGKITKQLLTFARNLEASIEPVHLAKTFHEILSFVEKDAELRSIEIQVQSQPYVPIIRSDRGKLEQIFLNIIHNAFASMNDGGLLRIQLSTLRENRVEIRIQDDGCGIPADYLDRIFEPFFSTKTGQGGTGLGLSITYKLINEIGGTVNVESEVGKGTCFIITLPVEPPTKEELKDARATCG